MAQPYQHGEAFNLMQYEARDGRERLVIWNSRDGVTAFGCSHPETGTELLHVRWSEDVRAVDHVPEVGDWIWVDLHPERGRQLAEQKVDAFWDHAEYPMRDVFESREQAIQVMFDGFFEHGTPPDLVQVTPLVREAFLTKAAAHG